MRAAFDIAKKTLEIDSLPTDYVKYFDLYFSFLNNGSTSVVFNNLSFGYSLYEEGRLIQSSTYPPANVRYVNSDQEFIESDRIYDLDPDLNYTLEIWVSHAGKMLEKTFEINMPRPIQPFDSWLWSEEFNEWMPPFLPPEDGNFYDWDEQSQTWVIVELDN